MAKAFKEILRGGESGGREYLSAGGTELHVRDASERKKGFSHSLLLCRGLFSALRETFSPKFLGCRREKSSFFPVFLTADLCRASWLRNQGT